MERREILGVSFDPVTMTEAVERLESFVQSRSPHLVVTANPETVMRAQGDLLLAEILRRADLVVPDGIGVVWAGARLNQEFPERIPGIELAENLLARAAQTGWRVFLLGGEPGVAEQAAQSLKQRWPDLQIVGTYHGFFKSDGEEEELISRLQKEKPHILLAALGMPRQEKWLAAHQGVLKVPVAIGVGGSFNVWAGVDKRAPRWLRSLHLEWLYRILRQPWRIKRAAALPLFVLKVLRAKQ